MRREIGYAELKVGYAEKNSQILKFLTIKNNRI